MLKKGFVLDCVFSLFIIASLLYSIVYSFDNLPLLISFSSIYVVIAAYYKQGFYSFIFLFTVSFVLFNSSRYMLDVCGLIEVRNIVYFANYTVDDVAYRVQSFTLISFLFCILAFVNFDSRNFKMFSYLNLSVYQKAILFLVFILAIFSQIYKVNFLLTFSESESYISFQGDYAKYISQVPMLPRYFSYFFSVSFFLLVTSIKLSKRSFKLLALLYLLVFVYTTMLGGRALFFTNLFVVIWLYGKLYNIHTVSFKKLSFISLGLLGLLGLGQFAVVSRMGGENMPDITLVLPLILYDQGTSITVFSLLYKTIDIVNNYEVLSNHLIRYLYMPFSGVLSYLDINFKFMSFVEVISYTIDPSSAKLGYGLGGNLMAELYLYFKWGAVVIFYALLTLYRKISDLSGLKYFYVLVPIAMQGIFFSPRSYAFDFFIEVGRNFVYVLLLTIVLWVTRYVTTMYRSNHI
jgi:hypothetical protein